MNSSSIVESYTQDVLEVVLIANVNLFLIELQTAESCKMRALRTSSAREKNNLTDHANDAQRNMEIVKTSIEHLGLTWDDALLRQYRFSSPLRQLRSISTSYDDDVASIDFDVYARGVVVMEKLLELGDLARKYFPRFESIAANSAMHLARSKSVLQQRIDEDPAVNIVRAQFRCDRCRDHLYSYLWVDLASFVDKAIALGLFHADFRERTLSRFKDEMSSIGLAVNWSNAKQIEAGKSV